MNMQSGVTVYSVLVSGIGYSALSALADALDRRAKHVYAMRVLEVCVAILQASDARDPPPPLSLC